MNKLSDIVKIFLGIISSIYFHFIDNHLLEANVSLQTQNAKLNDDVQHLRLSNVGLERASEARLISFSLVGENHCLILVKI